MSEAVLPRVTLVVAMLNEVSSIEDCLDSIARQDYPNDLLEIMVYDGGSTDGSREIAERFVRGRPRWSIRPNPRRIQSAAWNAGIAAGSGAVAGIVSSHAELGQGYVRTAVDALRRTGADMVGGPVQAIGDGVVGQAVALAISTPFGVGGARHHYLTEPGEVDTVFMGVCRRETWLRFPFDETMVRNQDDELSYRLLDAGGRIICDPAIRSTYRSRSDLTSLWRQFFDYGRWKVRVLRAHPRQARVRHLIPVTLVIVVGGGLLLSIVWDVARVGTLAVVGLYAATTVAAALRYGDRHRPRVSLALLAVYPTIHAAYGLGMIDGFFRFMVGGRFRRPAPVPSASDRGVSDGA